MSAGMLDTELLTRKGDIITMQEVLAKTEGQKKIIHFWASWCPPCFYEIERTAEISEELGQDGVAILNISLDSKIDVWNKGSEKLSTFFNSDHPFMIVDTESDLTKELNIKFVSSCVLLDQQ